MGASDPMALKLEDGSAAVPPGSRSSESASADPAPAPGLLSCLPSNKGDVSNLVAFITMVVGIFAHSSFPKYVFLKYLLSFGLFSFAGGRIVQVAEQQAGNSIAVSNAVNTSIQLAGITNWLAVKMLFDRIPGLYGSGVIPRQFVSIREVVKNTIMKTFFDSEYLEGYINERAKGLLATLDLGSRIKSGMDKPEFDARLVKKMTEVSRGLASG